MPEYTRSVEQSSVASTAKLPQLGLPIRREFPIFSGPKSGHQAYLDTAASSQKPRVVIDRLTEYLRHEHANIHRGAYALSARATSLYDEAREKVAKFIGSPSPDNLVFVRGTTEAINLVAHSFGDQFSAGDVVMLTMLEHHSNIVPWQLLAQRRKVTIDWIDIESSGELKLETAVAKLRAVKPKLLCITSVSNALGTVVPIQEIIAEAHRLGTKVLVDAAQSIAHSTINVAALDVDFLAVSGHKLYGPTGSGFLYGKKELLEQMDPFMGGGDMIEQVTTAGSTWASVPRKFEAGTPAIGEMIALGTAVDFVSNIGAEAIARHEHEVFEYGIEQLSAEPGVSVYGPHKTPGKQVSILPFNVNGVHPHDLASIADTCGVQIRAGHHCAMPLLKRLGLQSTARASLGVYSCPEDIDALIGAIRKAKKVFGS